MKLKKFVFNPAISLLGIVLLIVYFLISDIFLKHNDIGLHIAVGDLIRSLGAIPFSDSWSFTAGDTQWFNIVSLWDICLSLLFQAGGFSMLIACTIIIALTIIFLLTTLAIRRKCNLVVIIFFSVCLGLILPTYNIPSDYQVSISTQTFTLFIATIFYYLLQKISSLAFWWRLTVFPLLMILWVNCHGGFFIGYAILGAFWLEELAGGERKTVWHLTVIGLLCLVAAIVNPYGINILQGITRTLDSPSLALITEWQPYNFSHSLFANAWIFYCLFLVLVKFSKDEIRLSEKILFFIFFCLGMLQTRHFALFLIFSFVPVVIATSSIIRDSKNFFFVKLTVLDQHLRQGFSNPIERNSLFLLFLLTLVSILFLLFHRTFSLPTDVYPREEIAFIEQNYPNAHVFNHWNLGSFIIFQTRGRVKVMIDGRTETAYPRSLINDIVKFATWQDWNSIFDKYHPDLAIMPKYERSAIFFFDNSPRWTLVYDGPLAKVYSKEY